MANYMLHLGFNWKSPLIGSTWGSGQISEEYRFLQYALASSTGSPAWFQFAIGDVLSVTIWDLTSTPSLKELTLAMSFGVLEVGDLKTYDPSTLVDTSAAESLQNERGDYYLLFNNVSGTVTVPGQSGPWGDSQFVYSSGPITFSQNSNYKLSFYLKADSSSGKPRVFISDPEVIVGSRGG